MSERECSGFDGPPTTVPAEEPVRISPDAVRRIGPGGFGAFDQSTSFTVLRLESVFPAALYRSVAGEPAMAVGQPASQTCRPSSALIGTAPAFRAVLVVPRRGRRPARLRPCAKPRRSAGSTSRMDRSSTSPSGSSPAAISSCSQVQAAGSASL
jgi:hypothetical protein